MARLGGRAPKDYADCFAALAELGVVSADLAGRLQRMARFRDLLVHLYAEVDDRRVYEILRADVADLDELRSQVLDWLNEHG